MCERNGILNSVLQNPAQRTPGSSASGPTWGSESWGGSQHQLPFGLRSVQSEAFWVLPHRDELFNRQGTVMSPDEGAEVAETLYRPPPKALY